MYRVLLLLIPFFLINCGMGKTVLQEYKELPAYPSASAVEYVDGRFYIMGDDARSLLVLDSALNILDTILLFPGEGNRIVKPEKPDLESMILLDSNKLLLLGSGSLKPTRCRAYLVDPSTRSIDSLNLEGFYDRFPSAGIGETNIEGACALPASMLLANRGNMSYRHNELVFTSPEFYLHPEHSYISRSLFGVNTDTSSFQGLSGLAYSKSNDLLIATVSTEHTSNAYDDGKIGKSYLWLVDNISAKTNWKAINPDRIIDLSAVDSRFGGHKIEGVCIWKQNKEYLYLLLVADDDKGGSALFKLAVKR